MLEMTKMEITMLTMDGDDDDDDKEEEGRGGGDDVDAEHIWRYHTWEDAVFKLLYWFRVLSSPPSSPSPDHHLRWTRRPACPGLRTLGAGEELEGMESCEERRESEYFLATGVDMLCLDRLLEATTYFTSSMSLCPASPIP